MDYLREGVSLRGYGQRDPLIEYQREGYDMFTTMMDGIKEDSVGSLFNLQVQVQENPIMSQEGADGAAPAAPVISMAQAAAPVAPPGVASPPVAPQGGSPRQPAQPAQPGRKAGRPAGQPAAHGTAVRSDR